MVFRHPDRRDGCPRFAHNNEFAEFVLILRALGPLADRAKGIDKARRQCIRNEFVELGLWYATGILETRSKI